MADNKSTFLFYDKAVEDNHGIQQPLTKNITMESIFTSNHKYTEGTQAIKNFNKLFPDNAIPEHLDANLYNAYLFSYLDGGANIRITVIEVKNDKLKYYVNKKIEEEKKLNANSLKDGKSLDKIKRIIPNYEFLIVLCNYHTLYCKATLNIDILDRTYDQRKITENTKQITTTAMIPNADLADPIEQQPTYAEINLYNYQKRTIKWMSDREKNYESIYYNKNEEIIMGDVVYDATTQDFMLADNREKLIFKGGALIDEVGLGKTYQMIMVSLINQAKNINYIQKGYTKFFSRATLIICPNQLVGQWSREFGKVIKQKYGINTVTLFTKNHHDKYTYQDLLDADFVVVSFNFLGNQCFTQPWLSKISTIKSYLTSEKYYSFSDCEKTITSMGKELMNNISNITNTCPNPLLIHWHRIVVDEIHEVYTNEKVKFVASVLPLFQANYKWCLTATPFDKSDNCLLGMIKYVTDTTNKIDSKVLKDKSIYDYLLKNFFRRNTKKSVMSEYQLPALKESLIWLNFSKTEWMMYNAYMANPNIDKFGVLIRQICCHPKLAEEIKTVASNCKSLEDIEKVMVKHYASQFKKAYAKVRYIEYRIKKVQRKIKILDLKRQRVLLRKLGFKVEVEFDNKPILSGKEVQELEKDLQGDPHLAGQFENNYNDEEDNPFDESDSDEDEKGKKKKLFVICDKNKDEIQKLIGKELKNLPNSILDQMDSEKNWKDKFTLANEDYKGKKATYDYYNEVMEKLKLVSQVQGEIDSDSDSDSDDDDNKTKQKCGVCMGNITGSDLGVTKCGHIFCYNCVKPFVEKSNKCPSCQTIVKSDEIFMVEKKVSVTEQDEEQKQEFKDKQHLVSKVGTKLANLIFFLRQNGKHSIIFSQWDDLLVKVGEVLDEYGIKNVFCKGNVWQRDKAIREFNSSDDIKVIMLSSQSAASGTNLTKAENVILLDPVYGTYEYRRNTEWQAIGRAYRMGQTKQVNVVRFIIKGTVEEKIYNMNKDEESKVPVQSIKFETTDESINLDQEQLNKLATDAKKAQKKKEEKPKKTIKKKSDVVEEAKLLLSDTDDDY